MTSSDTRNGNVIPGRDELVARAHALQPLLLEYAAKTDAGRCLPDAVNAALSEAGFFRLLTPQCFGGYEPACGLSSRSPRRSVPQHRRHRHEGYPVDRLRGGDRLSVVGNRGHGDQPVVGDEDVFAEPGIASGATLLGPLLGAGQAALDLVIEKAPCKGMHHTFFASQSESVGVQIQLGEAAMKLRTARLHINEIVEDLDEVANGGEVDYETRARIKAQAGKAAQQVLQAIHELVNIHGAGSFAESSRMQQIWRDANTAARHAGLNAAVGYEVHGKALLDIDERITAMI